MDLFRHTKNWYTSTHEALTILSTRALKYRHACAGQTLDQYRVSLKNQKLISYREAGNSSRPPRRTSAYRQSGWWLIALPDVAKRKNPAAWHLVHAGGTVRGVLLIALAAIIPLLALPLSQVSFLVWLMIISIWASMLAMVIAAISGDRGLRLGGSLTNKLVYLFYAIHIVTILLAFILLIYGLLNALQIKHRAFYV
jgi:hypothetical protein